MKPEYTIEEIHLAMEAKCLDAESDRLRVLWAEKCREVDTVRDDAAFLVNEKLKKIRNTEGYMV
jgi:hypothetical protein